MFVANHPFYLRGQTADLTVSANYMVWQARSSRPRPHRPRSSPWNGNYREQEMGNRTGGISGGANLERREERVSTLPSISPKDHSNLQDTDWKRFEDLRYCRLR